MMKLVVMVPITTISFRILLIVHSLMIDIIDTDGQSLEEITQALNEESKRDGLNVNLEKSKTMVFGERAPNIEDNHLENVEQFTYLECNMTYDLDNMKEVRTRLAEATKALKASEKVWRSKNIEIETKKKVLHTCVFSTLLYGCEAWVVTRAI